MTRRRGDMRAWLTPLLTCWTCYYGDNRTFFIHLFSVEFYTTTLMRLTTAVATMQSRLISGNRRVCGFRACGKWCFRGVFFPWHLYNACRRVVVHGELSVFINRDVPQQVRSVLAAYRCACVHVCRRAHARDSNIPTVKRKVPPSNCQKILRFCGWLRKMIFTKCKWVLFSYTMTALLCLFPVLYFIHLHCTNSGMYGGPSCPSKLWHNNLANWHTTPCSSTHYLAAWMGEVSPLSWPGTVLPCWEGKNTYVFLKGDKVDVFQTDHLDDSVEPERGKNK